MRGTGWVLGWDNFVNRAQRVERAEIPEVVQARNGSLTEGRCKTSTVRGRATVHALMSRQASPLPTRKHFPPT